MNDLILSFWAWFIFLCTIILPFFAMVKLVKAIKRKCKKKPKITVYSPSEEQWKSEWKWNEKTQLWEHPLSHKSDSEYHYSKEDLGKNEQTHFHHPDTTFKAQPISITEEKQEEIKITIPDDIQEIIEKTKREKTETINQPPKPQEPQKAKYKQYTTMGPRLIYTYPKAELKPTDREVAEPELDFKNAYQRKDFFTRNEWQNYKKLKAIADEKGLVVCPKVRLFDIIEPRLDKKRKLTYRYKIQAKHVDFVICDQDMKILAILELDDNSHYDPERIKRDDFVNTILLSVGYTVIHTKYIEYNILDML